MELNKIYCMNNVQGMRQLDNESVDLVVTSPIKTYDKGGWNIHDVILWLNCDLPKLDED